MSGKIEREKPRPAGVTPQQARKNARAAMRQAVRRIVAHSPIDSALASVRHRIVL